MDVKKLMFRAAVLALALPLLIAGSASAKYMGDGAVQDGTTGGWITPNDMVCIVGVHADGTLDIADGVTSRRNCIYLQTGTMNGGTPFDLSAIPTSALCTNATNTYTGAKHSWATTFCTKSLTGLDRTQKMCEGIGGTWVTTGKCVAYGAQFKGQDASGTPKPMGTKGTVQAAGTGYCYANMNMTTAYATQAACPSNMAVVAPFNTNAAYDWSWTSSQCRYSKGIAGYLTSALTKADSTTYAAGTYLDMSTFTTMGDCLANGGSWANWIGQAASTTSIPTTPTASTIPAWDYKTQVPDADEGCLHCHSTVTEYNGPAERFKESFLKTGHKNMLRKVTAGKKWAGPDGVDYATLGYAAGSINWGTLGNNDATATVSGVAKPLLYIFGDWMAAAPAGLDVVVDMGAAGAKYNGTSNYSCAACHATGWGNSSGGLCSLSSYTTSANCSTAGGTWYPSIGVEAIGDSTYVPQEPAASFPGITFTGAGKWDLDGITCGRCHNAQVGPITQAAIDASQFPKTVPTGGGMGNVPGGPTGAWATNLCFGCHQSMAKTANGTGANADLSNPTALIVKNNATAPAYVPGFSGHVIGNSFLNSPHARATADVVPNALGKYDINNITYNSTFKGYMCWQSPSSTSPAKTKADGTEIKDKATCEGLYGAGSWRPDTQGNCTTCHDVHNSMFVVGQEGLRKECVSCHNNSTYATDVPGTAQASSISHPSGTGTPMADDDPCVVCHMPKPTDADFPMHVWRINSDPNYSTFPTASQFGIGATATKKNANTAVDSKGFTNAVWVDLDLSCGECHGTNGTAHLISKTGIASYAAAMHTGAGVPTTDCATCHAASQNGFVAIKGGFGPGKNHHGGVPGETADCIGCHTRPGTLPANWDASDAGSGTQFCLACHQNYPTVNALVPRVSHHGGACVTCHLPNDTTGTAKVTGPGVIPVLVVGGCAKCHPEKTFAELNHTLTTGAPSTCQTCHFAGGFIPKPSADHTCDQCHGGGLVSSAPTGTIASGVTWLSSASLAAAATGMHNGITAPTPRFVWSNSTTTSYVVNFNAGSTICPTGSTCSDAWDFGDSTTGTGATASHLFTMPTPSSTFSVKLTVTADDGLGHTKAASITKVVSPVFVNTAPVAAGLSVAYPSTSTNPAIVTNSTNVVTFTDSSSDVDGNILSVSVNWGDGFVDTQAAPGGVFTHNYTRASKFGIIHTVRDKGGKSNVERAYVKIVPPKYVVSGTVKAGGLPVNGAYVSLKFNGRSKAGATTTSGNFTLASQLTGTYTMTVYKSGCTFANPAATVNLTGPATVNITGTCP